MKKVLSKYYRKYGFDCKSKPLSKLIYENNDDAFEVISTANIKAVIEVVLALILKLGSIAILYVLFDRFIFSLLSTNAAKDTSDFIFSAATIPAWLLIKEIPDQLHFCFAKVCIYEEYVTKKTGFFSKHTSKLYFKDIDNIQLNRPFLARAMGFTDVTLTSHGGDIELPNIFETDDSLQKLKLITAKLSA